MMNQYTMYRMPADVSVHAARFLEEAAMTPDEELERRVNAYHTSLSSWERLALHFGFRQEPPHIWAYDVELQRRKILSDQMNLIKSQ